MGCWRLFGLGGILLLAGIAAAALSSTAPSATERWAVLAASPSNAGDRESDLEIVSRYGPDLAAYATVRRDDGTYRRMLVSPEALEPSGADGALPEGTRILMETYYRPGQVGTVFHKRRVGGAWHYGSFPAARPDLTVRPQASCLACHARAAETDFTLTLPSLRKAAEGKGPSDFTCDRGGRSPCSLQTYLEGALP